MTNTNRLFAGCIFALIATAFGFIVRAMLLNTLGVEFDLSESQKGALQGAGLFPFALSIIFFSLIVDRVGYGRAMAFAWVLHVASALITVTATSFTSLYLGTLLFSLANGTIEAVVNPVTATLFPHNKTPKLIMLHSGWAAGLVLGGLFAIALGDLAWRWKIGLFLLPTIVYGVMMLGRKFPVQERVAARVPYADMMREFGWAGCFIVCIFTVYAVNEACLVFGTSILPENHSLLAAVGYAIVPTILFALVYRAFGQPVFIFLLGIMVLLATTELGTDSWISDLLTPGLRDLGENAGNWVLVYTSAIMFGLRFFAGPLARKFTPVGLLVACSAIASLGLFCLAHAGTAPILVFAAATLYALGKSFFWPTTLGLVSEQFPRGGALTINAMAGVGMIAVGVLGGPFLGTLQDVSLDKNLRLADPAVHAQVALPPQKKFGLEFQPLDKTRIAALPGSDQATVARVISASNRRVLAKIAVLPAIMCICYVGLELYFRRKGGYRQVELSQNKTEPCKAIKR